MAEKNRPARNVKPAGRLVVCMKASSMDIVLFGSNAAVRLPNR
jgi:hypothetical protein